MAIFCGKCGSRLDENGLCPKCNKVQNAPSQERNVDPNVGPASQKNVTENAINLTAKQKRASKKAEKKRIKKEKLSAMPLGQKVKRLVLKFLAVILTLAILLGSVSCVLVYFNVTDIPFVEKVMGWFGYEKEQPKETHFASIPGKFTDKRITSADEAIQAAQSVASQLGLQKATDELTLLNENTVGNLTYYRLQQNYQGIPVYGKAIVVVADDNGEAKNITSNAIEVDSVNLNADYSNPELNTALKDYLSGEGNQEVNNVVVESIAQNDLLIYPTDNGKFVMAAYVNVSFETTYGKAQKDVIVDLEKKEVILSLDKINANNAVCYGPTKQSGSFNGLMIRESNENCYFMKDTDRNIYIYNAQGRTYWDPNPGTIYKENIARVTSTDEYFGNDVNNEESYERAFSVLKALSCAYDFYKDKFSDPGIGTLIGVYDDQVGDYNGNNAGGGILPISDITDDELLDYVDPNQKNKYKGKSGLVIIGTGISEDINRNLDVVFHEYTHFITRKNVDWITIEKFTRTADEPGAINEGYSDIFGEIMEGFYNNREPDWNNKCRSLSNPMSKGFPAKIGDKKWQQNGDSWEMRHDNGATDYSHGFSTIVSHAAYLMHTNSKNGQPLNIEKLANLWYNTMLILPSDCSFSVLRHYMEITAEVLGYSSEEKDCISAAFDEVGIVKERDNILNCYTKSEVSVFDRNNLLYDDYTIVIDGENFNGLFEWGWKKSKYHKEIPVDSAEPYELVLPKGNYTITVFDNFSGSKTYSQSVKVRENGKLKDIKFKAAFGFDFNVGTHPELRVKDVNEALYDNYSVSISGKSENGATYKNAFDANESAAQQIDLETGRYAFLLKDRYDMSKTKTFSVRVRSDAASNILTVKTKFGKPYGEYEGTDVPSGAEEFNGHYYYVYNMPEITTWEAAQEFCRSRNGYLATLTTREENSFAYSLLNRFNVTGAYFGLHDVGYNEWQWANNEKFDYANWAYGEPSSYSERYGMFFEQYVETWNDGDFGNYTSQDRAFICEWGPYEVNYEEIPETPTQSDSSGERDIVLCLDMSGSMDGDKLQQTKESSIKFVNTVLQQDASIAIVTYDSSARVLSNFSRNAGDLISRINEISVGGSTDIEDGLVKSCDLLNYSNAKKKIIVLMSDGEPNEGKVGEELISYADSIKREGTYIYTLGFFGGYSGQSAAQNLMERIASEGCHYEVSDADSLVFFFGDIADTINGQEYIYIRIACPVDVKVSYNGETLNSKEGKISTRTSFGSLSFEENTSEVNESSADDRVKILRLKADGNYNISIEGNGRGRMNYTIGFMDENGEYTDFRKFTNIKINKNTIIDTVAEKSSKTVLNVDDDGDGKYDIKYKAGANERGEVVDYTYILYIFVAVFSLAAVTTAFLIARNKKAKRRRGVK